MPQTGQNRARQISEPSAETTPTDADVLLLGYDAV
jgi:hypothetical protein